MRTVMSDSKWYSMVKGKIPELINDIKDREYVLDLIGSIEESELCMADEELKNILDDLYKIQSIMDIYPRR